MKDGLYIANFRTPLDEASGIIVIQGDRVMGGDGGMYYTGTVTGEERVEVTMTVRKHSEAAQSVFGDFDAFKLTLTGQRNGEAYEFSGRADAAPSMKFTAQLVPAKV